MKKDRMVDSIYSLLTGIIAIFIIAGILVTGVVLEQHKTIEKYEILIEGYRNDYDILRGETELLEEVLIDAKVEIDRYIQKVEVYDHILERLGQ